MNRTKNRILDAISWDTIVGVPMDTYRSRFSEQKTPSRRRGEENCVNESTALHVMCGGEMAIRDLFVD